MSGSGTHRVQTIFLSLCQLDADSSSKVREELQMLNSTLCLNGGPCTIPCIDFPPSSQNHNCRLYLCCLQLWPLDIHSLPYFHAFARTICDAWGLQPSLQSSHWLTQLTSRSQQRPECPQEDLHGLSRPLPADFLQMALFTLLVIA